MDAENASGITSDTLDELVRLRREEKAWAAVKADLERALAEVSVYREELRNQNEELKLAAQEIALSRQRYRDLFDFAPTGYFTLDRNGILSETNLAGANMLGHGRDRLSGRPLVNFLKSRDHAAFFSHLRTVFEGRHASCEVEMSMPTGKLCHLELRSAPMLEADGLIRQCRTAAIDITERFLAMQALTRSESRFRAMFEHSNSGVAVYEAVEGGRDFVFKDLNPAGEAISHIRRDEVVGRRLLDMFPAMEGRSLLDALRRVQASGQPERLSDDYYSDERRSGWRKHFVSRLPGGELMVIFEDITARKEAEARLTSSLREKEILLKEIHHRVKNNLQIVSSLLNLQATRSDDPGAARCLLDCRHRVQAMALVHEELYRSKDFGVIDLEHYLTRLVEKLQAGMSERADVEVRLRLSGIRLPLDAAIPCGLLVNELVTNALKHAFRDRQKGVLEVCLLHEGNEAVLSVCDDGVGLPQDIDPASAPGLGLQLVHSLADQLRAALEITRDNGTRFRLTFPLAD